MASINDLTIVNSNTAEARRVESGTEVTLCSPDFCGSKNLSVYKRTIFPGRKFDVQAEATRRESLVRAREQLERAEANIVGVVLNRARDHVPAFLRPYISTE